MTKLRLAPKTFSLRPSRGGAYFTEPSKHFEFIDSGCAIFNCVLGGGWAEGIVSNLIGDTSTGKTLLATEACANFRLKHEGDGDMWYREIEARFDPEYAKALGLPVDEIDFGDSIRTIEDLFDDVNQIVANQPAKRPGIYIIDSFDALSSEAERAAGMGKIMKDGSREGSYDMMKQKQIGKFFRLLMRDVQKKKLHIMFVSQVREAINVSFGSKLRRSGGKALDFYASQIVWLAHLGKLKRTIRGVERAVADRIRAKCTKNSCGMAFRECELSLKFGYGMDDVESGLRFLKEVKRLGELDHGINEKEVTAFVNNVDEMELSDLEAFRTNLNETVARVWKEIELDFIPRRRKYK